MKCKCDGNILVRREGCVSGGLGLPRRKVVPMHSAGIQAMGVLMDRLVPRIPKGHSFDAELREALIAIKPRCAWTNGEWEGLGMKWNEIKLCHDT